MQQKYKFTAIYSDDSTYTQSPDDKSLFNGPDKSSFSDVLDRIDEVVKFVLINNTGTEEISVDLKTGLFTIRGCFPFKACDPSLELPSEEKLRLVYFRRNRRHFNGDVQVDHEIEYHIGWQVTVGGKNYVQTIAIL